MSGGGHSRATFTGRGWIKVSASDSYRVMSFLIPRRPVRPRSTSWYRRIESTTAPSRRIAMSLDRTAPSGAAWTTLASS